MANLFSLKWCGGTTDNNVPWWQPFIVNLTVWLLITASLRITSQVISIVLEVGDSWDNTPRLIGCGMLLASTLAVIISTIVNLQLCKPQRFNCVSVIVVNRFAALVCAVNAVWLAIGIQRNIDVGSPILSHLPHLAGLFLTVLESAFSLLLSCICLKWGDLKSRQTALALSHIINGGCLPFIGMGGLTLSPELEWLAFILLAWSIFFVIFGVMGVFAYHKACKVVHVVMTVLMVTNLLFAIFFILATITGFFNHSNQGSLICIENLDLKCSDVKDIFCGLCLFLAIEEFMVTFLSIKRPNDEANGENIDSSAEYLNRIIIERQEMLPPSYEEIFSGPGLGIPDHDCSSVPNLEVIVLGASGEEDHFLGDTPPSLERQESLPPQYEDVINMINVLQASRDSAGKESLDIQQWEQL